MTTAPMSLYVKKISITRFLFVFFHVKREQNNSRYLSSTLPSSKKIATHLIIIADYLWQYVKQH